MVRPGDEPFILTIAFSFEQPGWPFDLYCPMSKVHRKRLVMP